MSTTIHRYDITNEEKKSTIAVHRNRLWKEKAVCIVDTHYRNIFCKIFCIYVANYYICC